MNPTIVEGQIHGGVAQGIGGAFYERLVYDEAGQLRSGSFMDFLIATAVEIPEIEIVHRETPSPLNPPRILALIAEAGPAAPPATADQRLAPVRRERFSVLFSLAAGLGVGLAYPAIDLLLACRAPTSEACVWGKAYFPLTLVVSGVVLGGIVAVVTYVLLARLRSR